MKDTALLSIALEPATPTDSERLVEGLRTLMAEDPTIRVHTDAGTRSVIIAGTGELHLDIIVERLKREFDVDARVRPPRVAYKEALTRSSDGEGTYVRQGGGRDEYAHVKIRLDPGEPGSGYVFENEMAAGAIPGEFIKPIDEGIQRTLVRGVLAGYPIEDVRIVLCDGSYHDVDSSQTAFAIAGAIAFKDATTRAGPVVLEPIMRVEVVIPDEHLREVRRHLSERHGRIRSQEAGNGTHTIKALAPLSRMLGYAGVLRESTDGRGTFVMRLDHYEPIRPDDNPGGGPAAVVTAPRRPRPTRRDARAELPEPDDDPE